MKKAWVLSYLLSAQRRLWSDWADAQVDLSLRWVHTHFVGFCHEAAHCFVYKQFLWDCLSSSFQSLFLNYYGMTMSFCCALLPPQHLISLSLSDSCPPGFFSATGYLPCDPCLVDTYWLGPTECSLCPDPTKTVWKHGAPDDSFCKGKTENNFILTVEKFSSGLQLLGITSNNVTELTDAF